MLRQHDDQPHPTVHQANPTIPYPSLDQPFETHSCAHGILFYLPKESFYLTYHLMETMSFSGDQMVLSFTDCQVIIRGRALHTLYHLIAERRISAIFEQAQRHDAVHDCPVRVTRIERAEA